MKESDTNKKKDRKQESLFLTWDLRPELLTDLITRDLSQEEDILLSMGRDRNKDDIIHMRVNIDEGINKEFIIARDKDEALEENGTSDDALELDEHESDESLSQTEEDLVDDRDQELEKNREEGDPDDERDEDLANEK